MARPRSFDDADIRSKVLTTFWKGGFDGTSVPDLEEATHLSRKSLYNAFGGKRAMFISALKSFRTNALETNTKPLQDQAASLSSIRAVLFGLVELAETPEGRHGCMVCNTSREEIRHDPEVKAEIDAYFHELEDRFSKAVQQGQIQGEINARASQDLARLCVGSVVSISVLSRADQPADLLSSIAAETIAALK